MVDSAIAFGSTVILYESKDERNLSRRAWALVGCRRAESQPIAGDSASLDLQCALAPRTG